MPKGSITINFFFFKLNGWKAETPSWRSQLFQIQPSFFSRYNITVTRALAGLEGVYKAIFGLSVCACVVRI